VAVISAVVKSATDAPSPFITAPMVTAPLTGIEMPALPSVRLVAEISVGRVSVKGSLLPVGVPERETQTVVLSITVSVIFIFSRSGYM
jgi:hypothetical protein